jgi:hypothetical protein
MFFALHSFERILKGLFVTKHMELYEKIVSKSPDFEGFFFFFQNLHI